LRLFVESNFVLELALHQEQRSFCEDLLRVCTSKSADLVLPSFCIGEPLQTLARRARERGELKQRLREALVLLGRTARYEAEAARLRNVLPLLTAANDEERRQLDETLRSVLKICRLIPLDHAVVARARTLELENELAPEDAIVASSVLEDLEANSAPSCFVTRDSSDFEVPNLMGKFGGLGCKVLFGFESALNYLRS
jgi:predicted nucleic acid-binding protein